MTVRPASPCLRRCALPILASAALVAGAAPACADVAPGRAWWDVGLPMPAPSVDGAGASLAVALPGGDTVLLGNEPRKGLVLLRVRRNGSADPAFGRGGIARVPVAPLPASGPHQPAMTFSPQTLLRQADGKLVVSGQGTARSRYELPRVQVLRLLPDGRPDGSFGTGGLVTLDGVHGSGRAALAPDGRIVLAATTGRVDPAIERDPTAAATFTFAVARLREDGSLDAAFDGDGVVEVAGTTGRNGGGHAVAVAPDGRITAVGSGPADPALVRLLPDGTPDPAFHGGTPARPALPYAFDLLVHADGSVDLSGAGRIVRHRPDGTPDAGFGAGGVLALGPPAVSTGNGMPVAPLVELLAQPGGGVLVHTTGPHGVHPAANGDVRLWRITPAGQLDPTLDGSTGRALGLGFGGGVATTFARLRALPVGSLDQSGFGLSALVPRDDGSLLAVGGTKVIRYHGEGEGFGTGVFAAAALAPDLRLDPSFGGPATRPALTVRVARQTVRGDRRLKRVALRATTTGPGLVLVRVRAGGRTIARMLEPVYAKGTTSLRIRLTRAGERVLRSRRSPLRVTVTATFRDLLAADDAATAHGTLRR